MHPSKQDLLGASLSACALAGFFAFGQPAAPPELTADERAQLAALERERRKEHDEAVQKAFGDYQKLMGETRSPGERAVVLAKLAAAEKDPKILSELSRKLADVELVRAEAIAALRQYYWDEEAAKALARALPACARDPVMLAKLLDTLGVVGHPAAAPAVMGFLKHEDEKVAKAAVRALGEMRHVGAIEPLVAAWEELENNKKKGGEIQKEAEKQLKALASPLREALQRLTGPHFEAPKDYRAWWVKHRATHRLKEPPSPVLCLKHLAPIALPGRPLPAGAVALEVWTGISGENLADWKKSVRLRTAPSYSREILSFELPANVGNNYGARIRGYLHPPIDGDYTFWMAAHSKAELFLSPDENPARKASIAKSLDPVNWREWEKHAEQKSKPVALRAGHRYYIEALHKQAQGNDHLSVAWKPPGAEREIIPGQHLSPFADVLGAAPPAASPEDPATAVSSTSPARGALPPAGGIAHELWGRVPGGKIDDLKKSNRLNTVPNRRTVLDAFEAPSNNAENFGARIYGYLHPPAPGAYTFWIASNKASELYLSPDENPARKALIASVKDFTNPRQWDKYPEQKSMPVTLLAGRRYYIEAIHKAGRGGNHLSVIWQPPGGSNEVIPGKYLSPAEATVAADAGAPEGLPAAPMPSDPTSAVAELISNTSPARYVWDTLKRGKHRLIDIETPIETIPPDLEGLPYLRTAYADRNVKEKAFISFDLAHESTLFIAYDTRSASRPAWMAGFVDTGKSIITQKYAIPFRLWAKDVPAGRVVLDGNVAGNAKADQKIPSMYSVILQPKRGPGSTPTPPRGIAAVPPPVPAAPPPAPRLDASRFAFYRAINLNGPGATIDGIPWESSAEAPNCLVFGKPYSNPAAVLEPAVDGEKLHMLRTAVTSSETASLILGRMPPGTYNVFLYAWSDGSSARFSIVIKGQTVAPNLTTGGAGRWERMGPWTVEVTDGTLNLVCMGGPVNLCGIEVWRK
jgi:hypothetical protein